MTQHNTTLTALAWAVVAATVLLSAPSLSALQVSQAVDTDVPVVVTTATPVVENTPVAEIRTTTAVTLVDREVTPAPTSTPSEGQEKATSLPGTEPLPGAAPTTGAPVATSEGEGSQTIDYTYISSLGRCWWYCTRIPLFCPCVVIWL